MNLHYQFKANVLNQMSKFLEASFPSLNDVPKALADEVKKIAERVKKSPDATRLRSYLLDYIALTSSVWRTLAPYTYYNQLLTHLEIVVNLPEYSPQSIQVAQITFLHEHYLTKQGELIKPLQIQIQTLQNTCEKLQATVSSLRDENDRLRVENDFFMKEMVALQSKLTETITTPAPKEPPSSTQSQTTCASELLTEITDQELSTTITENPIASTVVPAKH